MTELKLLVSYFALLALALVLASCDGSGPTTAATSKADRNDIAITVKWVPANKIDGACKAAGTKDGQHFNGCAASGAKACTIYAVQPRSFADETGLKALGHEAWHCFGARHGGQL